MFGERTMDGWEIRLKPSGVGRWFTAAFLLVWLCGWAAGETFALWFLIKGTYALLTGTPPDPGRQPLELAPAVAVGAFLLLWLTLWTIGGIAAMGQLLQMVWAEDRLTAQADGLIASHARGPFRTTRRIPRDALRSIALRPRGVLVAETDRETIELSRLGTPNEREQSAAALRSELRIPEATAETAAGMLPKGWQEVITPEGERALTVDLGTRRSQSRVASVLTLGAAVVAILLVRESLRSVGALPGAIMAFLFTAALAWGTVWLARGRTEWKIGSGRLIMRRRFGSNVRDVFEAHRLEITVTSDSDGDEWYALEAVAGTASATPPVVMPTRGLGKTRHRLVHVMHDPTVPRLLGAWLAQAASMPLDDRSTQRARRVDLAQLRQQLENSGRFGQLAARLIDRLEQRSKRA